MIIFHHREHGVHKVSRRKFTVTSVLSLWSLCALWLTFLIPFSHAGSPAPPDAKPYTKPYIGEMRTHVTAYEDTMIQIARDNNLGFNELRAANPGIDPWMPGENVALVLPTMHLLPEGAREGIILNLPEQRLYYFAVPGAPPVTHPVGIGREGLSTPMGHTSVVRKTIGPTWRPTPRMREEDPSLPESIGPGPDNPMGTHALYLGWPAYAIHGTNKPYGVGRRVSSGCVRMYPEDIAVMYDIVATGTKVAVVDQPVKVAWIGNDLYMEAHPSLLQADDVEQNGYVSTYEFTHKDLGRLVREAAPYTDRIDWSLVRKIVRERRGVPVVIASRPVGDISKIDKPDASGENGSRS